MKHWRCACGETWSDCHANITVAIPAHAIGERGHVVRISSGPLRVETSGRCNSVSAVVAAGKQVPGSGPTFPAERP